jgi:hypothetical protein
MSVLRAVISVDIPYMNLCLCLVVFIVDSCEKVQSFSMFHMLRPGGDKMCLFINELC